MIWTFEIVYLLHVDIVLVEALIFGYALLFEGMIMFLLQVG